MPSSLLTVIDCHFNRLVLGQSLKSSVTRRFTARHNHETVQDRVHPNTNLLPQVPLPLCVVRLYPRSSTLISTIQSLRNYDYFLILELRARFYVILFSSANQFLSWIGGFSCCTSRTRLISSLILTPSSRFSSRCFRTLRKMYVHCLIYSLIHRFDCIQDALICTLF